MGGADTNLTAMRGSIVLLALALAAVAGEAPPAGLAQAQAALSAGRIEDFAALLSRHPRLLTRGPLLFEALAQDDPVPMMILTRLDQLDRRDEHGLTPLMHAIGRGRLDLVRFLITKGANANHLARPKRIQSTTPLLMALGANAVGGKHAWQEAERRELVELLLAHGADANRADSGGETPLMAALARRDPVVVRRLLSANADPNAANRAGYTVLHRFHPAMAEAEAVLVALLEAGADPAVRGRRQEPVLHRLVRHQADPALLAHLLAHGADPTERDARGRTALIAAIAGGHGAAIAPLLAAGVDPNAADADGWTARLLAERLAANSPPTRVAQARAVVEALSAAGISKSGIDELTWQCFDDLANARIDRIQAHLEADGDLIRRWPSVLSPPLCLAAAKGAASLVPILVAAGAAVDATDHRGRTPLILAVLDPDRPTVEALLAAGADPSIRDDDGLNARSHAEHRRGKDLAPLLPANVAPVREGADAF